jgi:hypothetical protein
MPIGSRNSAEYNQATSKSKEIEDQLRVTSPSRQNKEADEEEQDEEFD